MDDFEAWWKAYPRKVGKLAAKKAYEKARRTASAAELLAGIDAYRESKPHYADFCHPTTWLTQGRWLDEPDPAASASPTLVHNARTGKQALKLIEQSEIRRNGQQRRA